MNEVPFQADSVSTTSSANALGAASDMNRLESHRIFFTWSSSSIDCLRRQINDPLGFAPLYRVDLLFGHALPDLLAPRVCAANALGPDRAARLVADQVVREGWLGPSR
jgi:hypothetical protein